MLIVTIMPHASGMMIKKLQNVTVSLALEVVANTVLVSDSTTLIH
jgi:hypothetical protein